MKRLLGWLLVVVVVGAVVVLIGPRVGDINWASGFRSHSDSDLTAESFQMIHNGMNRSEVTAILGLPSEDHMGSHIGSVADGGALDNRPRFLFWSDGGREVTVKFNPEGLVISKTCKGL